MVLNLFQLNDTSEDINLIIFRDSLNLLSKNARIL